MGITTGGKKLFPGWGDVMRVGSWTQYVILALVPTHGQAGKNVDDGAHYKFCLHNCPCINLGKIS
jgi:hypothetical protein